MKLSFCKVFRLIFVIFFLYLLGETLSRWNSFRMFASFSKFFPAIALVSVLSIVPLVLSIILIWILLFSFERLFNLLGSKMRTEHMIFFACFLVLFGVLIWESKKLLWPDTRATIHLKTAIVAFGSILSVYLTWILRKRIERWTGILQERITPLIWLFTLWLAVSILVVAYITWFKVPDKASAPDNIQSSFADDNKPNIILVTFDALSARNMSVYGYNRPTTPFISKWAKNASIFTRLIAASNETAPTTASLITGKRVWTHQRYNWSAMINDAENLSSLLKKAGYYNMAFIMNTVASVYKLGASNYFDSAPVTTDLSDPHDLWGIVDKFVNHLYENKVALHDWFVWEGFLWGKVLRIINNDSEKTRYPPEKAFNEFLETMDHNRPKPFFAWIHIFPPHDPYLPPEPYKGMFNTSSELRGRAKQDRLMENVFAPILWSYKPIPPEVEQKLSLMRDYYDEFIRYCDRQFEDFIAELKKRNLLKNTIIILSADHGESFEHDYPTHGGPHLYEQVINIPLIIAGVDESAGRVITDPVEQVDIPATILQLANIVLPPWMEGRSLVPLMHGQRLPQKPVYSMNLFKNFSGQKITKGTIAVLEGDYKLIYYLEREKYLLFNLKEDPDELNNLFDKEPERGRHLLSLIRSNLKKSNARIQENQ